MVDSKCGAFCVFSMAQSCGFLLFVACSLANWLAVYVADRLLILCRPAPDPCHEPWANHVDEPCSEHLCLCDGQLRRTVLTNHQDERFWRTMPDERSGRTIRNFMFLSTKIHVANHLTNHPSQTMYKKARGFGRRP